MARRRMSYSDIQKGDDVLGSDNKKIGDVDEVTPSYLHVSKGFLFTTDLYIPRDAVTNVEDHTVYLNVPSDRIEQMHWTEPPARRAGMGPEGRFVEREGEMTIPVREEELEVEKTMEQVGEVDVTKTVTEERKTMRVPRVHEEVTIERHRVDRPAEEPISGEETIRIPLREEEIRVEKHPRVREELVIKKHPVVEEEEVSGTVRREHVEVERHGREVERHEREERPRGRPELYEKVAPTGREYGREARPTGMGYGDITRGMDVYCSDNRKIGDVDEVTPDFVHVKKGFLFTSDLYIPKSAIDHVERDRVYLNVTCDRVEEMDWTQPPSRGTTIGR